MAQPAGYGPNLGFSRVGLGTSVVGTAYEQEVLLLAQPNLPFMPYARLNFAPGAKKGETLVFNIAGDITAGAALTAGTPIPLNTFSFQQIGMRLKEYGNGLSWDSSWDELFSYTSNANLFRQQLANDFAKVMNTQFLTTLDTAATTLCSFAAGSVAEKATIGTFGSYQIGTYMVHEMRRLFELNNVPKFPGPNGGYWVWAGHPSSFEFLRRSDAFTTVNLYAADRGQGNMLYTGADAWMYDGFMFIPTTTCTTSTTLNEIGRAHV